jgi:hypothetical protein
MEGELHSETNLGDAFDMTFKPSSHPHYPQFIHHFVPHHCNPISLLNAETNITKRTH